MLESNFANEEKGFFSREFNLANEGEKHFSREFSFADEGPIREIREIFFPQKFLTIKYFNFFTNSFQGF